MIDKHLSYSHLQWDQIPELKAPYLVVGFHGWSNAGNVSTDTVQYLIETLRPRVIATLDEEPFIHYTLDRPLAQIEDGIIHELERMSTQLMCWSNTDGNHDLVCFLGREPHMNWRGYCHVILSIIKELRIQRLYTIGGVQDTVSHAAPPLVTIVGSSPSVIEATMALDDNVKAAEYYGPISIHSSLIKACMDTGIQGVSLWGHAPAYLQRNPRIVAKIIYILNKALEMHCPTEKLTQRAIELERKINEALAKDYGFEAIC